MTGRCVRSSGTPAHLEPAAADRLDTLVRYDDPRGVEARYLVAVADPAYKSAFGKIVMSPQDAHLRFSREETEAVRAVNDVMVERAMSLTGASGGFAVPFELDPSIIVTSGGASNPIRQISRVVTVSVDAWRLQALALDWATIRPRNDQISPCG